MEIKFPNVKAKIVGGDGNAYAILGAVTTAMRRAGIEAEAIEAYKADAMSGDYDHLLRVSMSTVDCS